MNSPETRNVLNESPQMKKIQYCFNVKLMLTKRETSDYHPCAKLPHKWIGVAAKQLMFTQNLHTDAALETIVLTHGFHNIYGVSIVLERSKGDFCTNHHIIQKKSDIKIFSGSLQ